MTCGMPQGDAAANDMSQVASSPGYTSIVPEMLMRLGRRRPTGRLVTLASELCPEIRLPWVFDSSH